MQAQMTAMTVIIMLPTSYIFPALMRLTNTPPRSHTLRMEKMLRDIPCADDSFNEGHDFADDEGQEELMKALERGAM